MSENLLSINETLREARPALFESLSDLGRAAYSPPDIPFQAAQARDAELNATIGQITDGAGGILALPAIAEQLGSLGERHLSTSLLYSPVEGAPELRRLWSRRHRPQGAPASTLPLVTVGLTEALSLVADLFCGPDTPVVIPSPFWGNYRQIFGLRRGARIVGVDAYPDRIFSPGSVLEAVAEQPEGSPVVVILNFPSNPSGYSPRSEERETLVRGLTRAAESRPIVVVCDDAYAGLVFEDGIPAESIFWDLAGTHANLSPIKVDGATKELVLFGGRLGFLTFALRRESPEAAALENKVKCLLRATVGSPVAITQRLVVEALEVPGLADETARIRSTLQRRYLRLREALDEVDGDLLRPLPFNSGCFALLELQRGLDAEAVRRELLASYSTGVIAVGTQHVRIAYCSVREEAIPEVVNRLQSCLQEMSR